MTDHVHNFDRVLFPSNKLACTICDEIEPMEEGTSLFSLGRFILPSGKATHFKIECDMLTEQDWAAFARVAAEMLPPFGHVRGVPRGGLAFASALAKYITQGFDLLVIVDDVWVTGQSMANYRNQLPPGPTMGVVAFARNPVSPWVTALFQLNQRAEDVTYQLNRPYNVIQA